MPLRPHEGEILSLDNQIIPILRTTAFYASYDNGIHGFNQGQKVIPLGYQTSLKLNGSTGNVKVPHSNIWNFGTGEYSYMLWVKIDSFATSTQIFCKRDGGSGNIELQTLTSGKIIAYLSATESMQSASTFTTGQWYHIAIVRRGGTGYFFINGNLDVSLASTGNATTTSAITFGRDSYSNSEFFPGSISDFKLFNYGLTAQQVTNLMNTEMTGSETGLVGYWKFNETEGTIANDSSQYHNDGTASGGYSWGEGRTIATLRPDGKFGGAVEITEATTNLMTNPVTPKSWSNLADPAYGSISVDYIDTVFGVQGLRRVTDGSNQFQGDRIDIPFSSALDPALPYTFSVYARSNSPDQTQFEFDLQGVNSGGTRVDFIKYIDLTNEWKRYDVTFTLSSVGMVQTNMNLYVKLYCLANDAAQHAYEFVMPHLEQKAFPTSFVNGSRGAGKLIYPLNAISITPKEGTIHLRFRTSMNSFKSLIRILSLGNLVADNTTPRILICQTDASSVACYVNTDGIRRNLAFPTFTDGEWHMATISWKSDGKLLAFFDGVKTLDITYTSTYTSFDTDLAFGHDTTGAECNHLIDEIKIDKIAAAEDEIMSWHQSNAPFYNYLDYLGEVY